MHPREEYENHFMAVLYAYFDESGKDHEHEIIVFSGFLTTWKAWEGLNEEWNRLLREKNLTAIHFKEHKGRTSLMMKCLRAIKTNVEYGISISVNVADFNALPDYVKKEVGGTAGYFAFRSAVLAMTRHARAGDGNVIHFTCDEDEATTKDCYDWYLDVKRSLPNMRKCLASFCVADDMFLPQLQASDVFAGLVRHEANRQFLGDESSTKDLFDYLAAPELGSQLKFRGLFLDKKVLPDLASQLAQSVADRLISDPDSMER
jgi:hypothetical protein